MGKNKISFESSIKKLDSKVWGLYFPVSKNLAGHFDNGENRRVVCRLNDSVEIQMALMHDGEGDYFITLNKPLVKKLNAKEGDKLSVEMWKDESEYGMPMAEEFAELLRQDPEGKKHFKALTPGKQRNILYLVNQNKSSEKRLQKSLVVVNHLKELKGRLDFKLLYQQIKEMNR